jgi:hypothetical protein
MPSYFSIVLNYFMILSTIFFIFVSHVTISLRHFYYNAQSFCNFFGHFVISSVIYDFVSYFMIFVSHFCYIAESFVIWSHIFEISISHSYGLLNHS